MAKKTVPVPDIPDLIGAGEVGNKKLADDQKKAENKVSNLLTEERESDSQRRSDTQAQIHQPAKADKIKGEMPKEVGAKARYLRISPKKVRLVIDAIRGQNVLEALDRLQFINKKAVRFVMKALNSAIANAENNFKMKKEGLFIKKIIANEGPALHRWEPRAFGRAAAIKKRTTHLEIILAEKAVLKDKNEKAAKTAKKSKIFKKTPKKEQPKYEKKKNKTENSVV